METHLPSFYKEIYNSVSIESKRNGNLRLLEIVSVCTHHVSIESKRNGNRARLIQTRPSTVGFNRI